MNDLDYLKYETFMIDCRDNENSNSDFDMKICTDGPYGYMCLSPSDNNLNINTRYTIKRSRYYSQLMACEISKILFEEDCRNRYQSGNYIISFLMGGKIIELN